MLDVLLGTPLWIPLAIFAAYVIYAWWALDEAKRLRASIPQRRLPDGSLNPAYYDREAHWRAVERRINQLDKPRV